MTTPIGPPSSAQAPPIEPKSHSLEDPLGLPLVFKQWVVDYVTQEMQLQKVFGYQAPPVVVTGQIPALGETATAGTGFTYTHTDTTGVYVFTFTTAFDTPPTVSATSQTASRTAIVTALSATDFTVSVQTLGSSAVDGDFMFVALTTV